MGKTIGCVEKYENLKCISGVICVLYIKTLGEVFIKRKEDESSLFLCFPHEEWLGSPLQGLNGEVGETAVRRLGTQMSRRLGCFGPASGARKPRRRGAESSVQERAGGPTPRPGCRRSGARARLRQPADAAAFSILPSEWDRGGGIRRGTDRVHG